MIAVASLMVVAGCSSDDSSDDASDSADGSSTAGADASDATVDANQALVDTLPFDDTRDFDNATKGFIAPLPGEVMSSQDPDTPVWDTDAYGFVLGDEDSSDSDDATDGDTSGGDTASDSSTDTSENVDASTNEDDSSDDTSDADADTDSGDTDSGDSESDSGDTDSADTGDTVGGDFPEPTDGTDGPDTVNPSLWRNLQLNYTPGLYEVADGIYQIRGLDLANISFVRGDSGWVVFDPLTSKETAEAGLALLQEEVEDVPVTGVVISHSHADHFGGVRGVVDEADVESGDVPIVAPEGFTEAAVAENVMAGNAMSRRAAYQFGNLLPKGPTGTVGAGLGLQTSSGILGLLEPSITIGDGDTDLTVDGVKMETLYVPGTEAPAEFVLYLPKWKALWTAEDVTHTMHNILTPRGAKVRDTLLWTKAIDDMLFNWGGETEVLFAAHHWPTFGNDQAVELLTSQRDTYRYLHDESVRLINKGETAVEIAEEVALPDSLLSNWADHDYYGTLNFNAKAVYQYYIGSFDGVPANLNPLPPTESAEMFVEYMGGADDVLDKAQDDFDEGNYRGVAQVVNQVVFADPDNEDAKQLLADTYTQLGYQAESGVWRNFYLSGAQELTQGVNSDLPAPTSLSPDIIAAMDTDLILDYVAVLLKHEDAAEAGLENTVTIELPDVDETHLVELSNGVINHRQLSGQDDVEVDGTISVNRADLGAALLSGAGAASLFTGDDASGSVTGDVEDFQQALGMLDSFDFWFNIVTP